MKRRWERPAWPLPPLWKADGLRPDRHGLTDIRVLHVPRATQKRPVIRQNGKPASAARKKHRYFHHRKHQRVLLPCPYHTRRERPLLSALLHVSLLPRAAELRSPSAAYLLRTRVPMADFRHTALAASVHPCAHSAVRVGFRSPFLSKLPPDHIRSLRRQPHSILGPVFTCRATGPLPSIIAGAPAVVKGADGETVIFPHSPPPSDGRSPRTAAWTRTAPPCPSRRCRCCGRTAPARGTPPPGTDCGAPSAPAAG